MAKRMWDEGELKSLINKEAPKLENIKDIQGGVEATGDLIVKKNTFSEKNLSVGEDLDVAGTITEDSRPIMSIVKITDETATLKTVYDILVEMNAAGKHFIFDVSALSPSGKPFYLSCWNISEVGTGSYNVSFQDLINGKTTNTQVGNRLLTIKSFLGTLKDRNEFDTIKIGNTTLNEAQLQALLALLEN